MPVFFCGCSAGKRTFNNKNGKSITTLLIFPGYSTIEIIKAGDKHIRNESFSQEAENEIKSQLIKYIPSTVQTKYLECNDKLREEIANSGINLINTIKGSFSPGKINAPNLLLNVLDSLGENYGLFIYHGGFTRTPENLEKQYFKLKMLGVATQYRISYEIHFKHIILAIKRIPGNSKDV